MDHTLHDDVPRREADGVLTCDLFVCLQASLRRHGTPDEQLLVYPRIRRRSRGLGNGTALHHFIQKLFFADEEITGIDTRDILVVL